MDTNDNDNDNDVSTYGDDSVVMTDDETGFPVGPKRRQRASILLTSFDSPLGSPMSKTQPQPLSSSSSSSLDIASVLRIVSVEADSHDNVTTTTAMATATFQPTLTTEINEINAFDEDEDDDAMPMSSSPMVDTEHTLLSRLQVSSSRRETLSPASVRSMMFESMDQEQDQEQDQVQEQAQERELVRGQGQDNVAAADDDEEAELLVITYTTDRNTTDRGIDSSRIVGQGLGLGLGLGQGSGVGVESGVAVAVDLSGVDVKGTEGEGSVPCYTIPEPQCTLTCIISTLI